MRVGELPPATAAAALAGAPRLDAALAQFEAELDARALRRGTRLRCVVEGDAVRYLVVPWVADLATPSERLLLAQQAFRETFGEIARDWTVCQNSERYGAATLACAVDARLLDRMGAITAARGLELVSLQPALMHAFNQARLDIGQDLFWFVVVERHATTMLLMSAHAPRHVKRVPGSSTQLASLLDREWFALGIDSPQCKVYVTRSASAPAPPARPAAAAADAWRIVEIAAAPALV
jgi:hypothetical protein